MSPDAGLKACSTQPEDLLHPSLKACPTPGLRGCSTAPAAVLPFRDPT